jgi:Kef-type K+ transport system membrane component KefB
MIGGSLLMFSAPITFNSNILKKRKKLHKKAGYAFILGGIITGISALSMTVIFPHRFSNFNVFTNLLWGTLLVFSPIMALKSILAGRVKNHRAWMIRCYAVAAGPSGHRWLFFLVDIIGDFGVSLLIFLTGELIIRKVGLKTMKTMISMKKV